jgi:VanZ family protein
MRRLFEWLPAIVQMAAIFTLSSIPKLPSLPVGLTGYTGHFIGYAILGALALRGFAQARWAGVTGAAGAKAIAFASAYGVTDEFHQTFIPGRTSTVSDWCADTIGAAFGVAIVLWAARVVARRQGARSV